MLQLAPATRGSLNTAASRATAVGSKTVSASTVKSRSPLANRAAAFIAALRPHRVPWQITMSARPSARARSAAYGLAASSLLLRYRMLRPRPLAWSGVRGDVPGARSGVTHGAQDVLYDVKSSVTERNHRSRRCRKLQRSVNTPSHEQTRRAGCVIVFMDSHRQSLAGP